MGNSLRCCIACILPCGALDVIRIVHVNGHVEEVSGTILAGDVMKANPKHVLRKHCSEEEGGLRIIVLPPDALLKRGNIYFLIPVPSTPSPNSSSNSATAATDRPSSAKATVRRKRRKELQGETSPETKPPGGDNSETSSDRYLTEILSEKRCGLSRSSRRGRVGIWRPHLDSITEDL